MRRQKCFSLVLGARNTPSAGRHFTLADDKTIRALTFRHFPNGFTILDASGGWFDPVQRRFIEEDSRQILVSASGPRALRPWLGELAAALKQKELLLIEMGPAVTFVATSSGKVVKHPPGSTRRRK